MATVELAAAPGRRASYGRLAASDAFLRRRAITARIVSFILFLAAALSVFITAGIVYILVYDFHPVLQGSFDLRLPDRHRMDAGVRESEIRHHHAWCPAR